MIPMAIQSTMCLTISRARGGMPVVCVCSLILPMPQMPTRKAVSSISKEKILTKLRLMDASLRRDFGVIGEPTGMRMAVAEKGLMVLDCVSCGKSGHAARNEGVNAIYEALGPIDWFRNHVFDRVNDFLGPVKMTVTQIDAGTQHNVVPDRCTFVVDVRPNGMYTNPELLALIKDSVDCEVKERSTRIGSSSLPMDHPDRASYSARKPTTGFPEPRLKVAVKAVGIPAIPSSMAKPSFFSALISAPADFTSS